MPLHYKGMSNIDLCIAYGRLYESTAFRRKITVGKSSAKIGTTMHNWKHGLQRHIFVVALILKPHDM